MRANGDTLRGQIENGFWREPPAFIRFRPASEGVIQLFQPRQLRAVMFTGGRYFRYEALPLNRAAEVNLNRLSRGYIENIQIDSLLAEVLLESPTLLLRVIQNDIAHYLVRRPGRPYLELSEQKYLRETAAGSWAVTNGNNYKGQLSIYFGDCPAATEVVKTTPFTLTGIVGVIAAYNKACNASQLPERSWLAQATPRRRIAVQGGLMLGVRYNRVASTAGFDKYEFLDNKLHPVAGVFAEVFLPNRTTTIYGELSGSPFQSRASLYNFSTISGTTGATLYAFSYADYKAWLGSARIGLRRYAPLPRDQQLVLGLSYGLGWVLRPQFSTITTGGSNSTSTTLPAPADFKVSKLGFATQTLLPALTVGWRAQRLILAVEGQRCYGDGKSANEFVGSLVGSGWFARFTASYRLGRNPDETRRLPVRAN